MENISLAQRLNIAKDEVEAMAKRVNFMIYVSKENRLKEEHVTKIYDEWATVAKRLKKGRELLDQMDHSVPDREVLKKNDRYLKLCNLYDFLLAMLGYYDTFLKRTLGSDHYRQLSTGILEMLRD
jgi:hypothetical protein